MKPLPGKSSAPASALVSTFSALLTGHQSTREFEKHNANIVAKFGYGSELSRWAIGERLNEGRVVNHLQSLLDHLFRVTIRNLRILKQASSCHGIVALLDGIDLGQVHAGGGECEFCLKRKVGNEIRLYHRVVVISIMSTHGALPLFFRICRPREAVLDPLKVSDIRFKSDCELSCAKELLVEIAGRFGGRLPFDVVAGDALMANAPFMELVESLGSAGIFIFKQENRKLYQQAKTEFTGNSLGFNIQQTTWNKDPSNKGRTFKAQWGHYLDQNRKGKDKNVKIFEIKRTELDQTSTTGMAIASDKEFITARLVEEVRYAKWANLENGVFNDLTNIWGTLKHLFFHKANALQSMLYLQFLALIAYRCYCYGNLKRGGRCWNGTVRDFHRQMAASFFSCRRATIVEALANSPPR
jgi:hypothetical protein